MGSKRKNNNSEHISKHRKLKQPVNDDGKSLLKSDQFINEYDGYYPTKTNEELETIDISQIKSEKFYNDYVKQRKPVIINGMIPGINLDSFQLENIIDTLDSNELLLVEKRFKGGFGSGTERIKKTFGEFMQLLDGKDADHYYLTTQYAEDDPDEIDELLDHQNNGSDEDENRESEEPDSDDNNQEDEDNDDNDDNDEGFAQLPNVISDFSDTDSIDFNDIHDDFDDLNSEISEDLEVVSEALPGEPLRIDEATKRVHYLVQKPLTNLLKTNSLPLEPELLKKLTPQQINLWIGSAKLHNDREFKLKEKEHDLGLGRRIFGGGASSGLHHDHADNLYLLIKGHKRFTIFAPNEASKMYTVGDINHVFKSGVIDYKNNNKAPGWRQLRDDSAIITEVAKWRLDNEDENLTPKERDELINLIEKEEAILKGFESKVFDADKIKKDPPSFSTVPASIVHLDQITHDSKLQSRLLEFAKSKWPEFFNATRITVNLNPGQMLFLPAGWFHEVTSFGDSNKSRVHIALNYWYSPPNDKKKTYADSYWNEDYERTRVSCKYFSTH